MPHPHQVTVTVVVNGQPTEVHAEPHAELESIIIRALHQTGNAGQPPQNWELRDGHGALLNPEDKVERYAGQTLFLNLKAGVGG
jgi:hypothetical protein